MSTMQRMTLIGLYNDDASLFDNLTLPDGYDKDTFINSLLLEHGEKCVLYPNPAFLKSIFTTWSNKWALELSRIYDALTAEYNPIYNYDRHEESTDGHGKTYTSETNAGVKYTSETNAGVKYTSETNAGHKATDSPKYDDDITNDYDVTTSQDTDGTVEHQVSADNSGSYQPESKDITDIGKTIVENDGTIKRHIEGKTQDLAETSNAKTTDQTTNNSKTADQTTNNSKTSDSESETNSHTAHLYGNIGVTTSAAMVTEVVKQRFEMNLYRIATQIFASEFLIGIY